MFRELATRTLNGHRVLVLALSLSTVAGWGSLVVSSQSSAKVERHLRQELGNLQETQTKLLSERSKTRATLSEIAQLRAELTAARTEIARLSQPVDQAQPESPPVRPGAKGSARTSETNVDVSKTGSIGTKNTKLPPVKAASGEKPVPQARNGRAAAIRIATPGGKATEKPHRGAAPAIRPELDTTSLRQLTKSAEVQAQ